MKHACFTWVPHLHTQLQMGLHLQLAEENLKKLQDPDYRVCKRVITIDKLWIHHYDPKLRCESETWLQKGEQKHRNVW